MDITINHVDIKKNNSNRYFSRRELRGERGSRPLAGMVAITALGFAVFIISGSLLEIQIEVLVWLAPNVPFSHKLRSEIRIC